MIRLVVNAPERSKSNAELHRNTVCVCAHNCTKSVKVNTGAESDSNFTLRLCFPLQLGATDSRVLCKTCAILRLICSQLMFPPLI